MIPYAGVLFLLCGLDLGQAMSGGEEDLARARRQITNPNRKRVVCYHTSWSAYREVDKFAPQDIDPFLCTHVLYAYASIDKDIGLGPFDPKQDIQLEGYDKLIGLKKVNPKLKVMLAIGGSKEGSARFSKIAGDPQLRTNFAKNCLAYIDQFKFDGLDIVWKYPNFTEGSSFADKENYVELLKELRNEFKKDLIISIAVPSFATIIDHGFNLPELSKYVDFMTVLTYDYHVSTEPLVYHMAPLYPTPEDPFKELNVDTSIKEYIKRGVDPRKLNMAIALYGVIFVLEDEDKTDLGSQTEDEAMGTQERGAVIYIQMCKKLQTKMWTVKHVNKSAVGPYAYKDKLWVSFDDEDMVRTKAKYALEKNLGGIMFWSVDMDDFQGVCGTRWFPLINAAGEELGIHDTLNTVDMPEPDQSLFGTSSLETDKPEVSSAPTFFPGKIQVSRNRVLKMILTEALSSIQLMLVLIPCLVIGIS